MIWPLSTEAEDFIASAKVLAEPYEEDIARLTAERDAALAAVTAVRDVLAKWQDVDRYGPADELRSDVLAALGTVGQEKG